MNLVESVVESYMYADMFNRESENSSMEAKILGGGVPVKYIIPSLQHKESNDQLGPFANKVVPVGLVYIHIQTDPDVEYENHFHPGECRSLVPDSLYDKLMEPVIISHPFRNEIKKNKSAKNLKVVKDRSKKRRKI